MNTWKRRFFPKPNGQVKIVNPEKSGDYWITDGYTVFMGHFDFESSRWGIYAPDKFGVIEHCYSTESYNFGVVAFCSLHFPADYKKYQGIL